MKRIVTAAIALGFLVGAQGIAQTQEKKHTETTTKQTGPGPDAKAKGEIVVGTVKEYEAGKKIKLSGPDDKTYSFDLDERAEVQGAIVVGQMAKVTYHKESDGREHVMVLSEATKDAARGATAPKMHSESTMKHSGPGPDMKTKTEIVIGTVKEYEAGKKIKVTGPNDKEYSFDLDELGSAVQGPVAVGDRVKVTYTKTDSGDKLTSVALHKGKP